MLSASELECLESIETRAMCDFYAAAREGGDRDSVIETVGSATILMMPGGAPILFNRVVGLGVSAEPKRGELDLVIDRATERSDVWVTALAPHARPRSLLESLLARGFVPGYAWMKFHRGVETPTPFETKLEVAEVDGGRGTEFAQVVVDVYGLKPSVAAPLSRLPGRRNWTCWAAYDGAEAVAAMAMFQEGASAWIGFAATRPSHRALGAQLSLGAACIRRAGELGARRIAAETGERQSGRPDASYRNIARLGFKEAYLRPNLLSPGLAHLMGASRPG